MTGSWRGLVGSVLFPCPAPSYTIDSFAGELVWIPPAPGQPADGGGGGGAGTGEPDGDGHSSEPRPRADDPVPCLLLPYESARFLFIFFHSNAEDLGRCRWFCQFLRDQFQVHVLGVEYPGYGVCLGPPTREGVLANAEAALDFATGTLGLPMDQIKVIGRSIGTGPAIHLAARHKVAGLVLVTPFLNIRTLFYDRVGPLSFLADEWFDNEKEILSVVSPTMFIHGRKDQIIPFRHGEVLYKSCIARKLFITPVSMEHNSNLTADASYLIVPMFRFFALPDYCFRELKVPAFLFDKRRSPLYQKPEMEVSFRGIIPPTNFGGLVANMPEGDDAESPVDPGLDPLCQPLENLKGRARTAKGDSPIVDFEKVAVLTQPTVRHKYRATKQSYAFDTSENDKTALLPWKDKEDGPQDGNLGVLRKSPLGDHSSASRPSPFGSPVASGGAGNQKLFGMIARSPNRTKPAQPLGRKSDRNQGTRMAAERMSASTPSRAQQVAARFWGPGEASPASPPTALPLADVVGAKVDLVDDPDPEPLDGELPSPDGDGPAAAPGSPRSHKLQESLQLLGPL